jgi:hypothetical protein
MAAREEERGTVMVTSPALLEDSGGPTRAGQEAKSIEKASRVKAKAPMYIEPADFFINNFLTVEK